MIYRILVDTGSSEEMRDKPPVLRWIEDEKEQDCGGWRKGVSRIGYRLFDALGLVVNPTSAHGIMCCPMAQCNSLTKFSSVWSSNSMITEQR